MKKITLTLLTAIASFAAFAQVNTIVNVPAPNTNPGTSGNRGPNGTVNHTVMRAQYFVSQTDMAGVSSTVTSFGFNLSSGNSTAASGTITVYLQNTAATSFTTGTTWNTAGMTTVYTGTYNIPVGGGAASVDLSLPSAFTYTGSALNVSYEYTAAVTATNVAIYNCSVGTVTLGATGALSSVGAPVLNNTVFRPVFRFGTPNTVTNDISVDYVSAKGIIPANTYSLGSYSALIRNNSNTALTNVAVGYSLTGLNSASGSLVIPSLASGATTVLTFPTYSIPLNANGLNNITVAVLPDQNNTNNVATASSSINCNIWGSGPTVTDYTSTAIGFGTSSGILLSKFNLPKNSTLTGARIAVSSGTSNVGNSVYAVLTDAIGSTIATSNTISLTTPMLSTYQSFTFAPQNITANTDYYIGLAQPSNTTSYYPVASFSVPAIPPNLYATASLTSNIAVNLGQNLGYLGLQAQFAGACTSVGIHESTTLNANILVYPNPAVNGKTTITNLEGTNTIAVYNLLGALVSTQTSTNTSIVVDLTNQAAGNYFIRITDNNNNTKTVKVIN